MHRRWPDARGPPGSKSRACSQRGCRGTWEILSSPRVRVEARGSRHRRSTDEEPVNSNSPLAWRQAAVRGTARRTKESGAGRTAGSRSPLIVPRKPENRIPRNPVEGSEGPGHGTVEGKHERDIGPAV